MYINTFEIINMLIYFILLFYFFLKKNFKSLYMYICIYQQTTKLLLKIAI